MLSATEFATEYKKKNKNVTLTQLMEAYGKYKQEQQALEKDIAPVKTTTDATSAVSTANSTPSLLDLKNTIGASAVKNAVTSYSPTKTSLSTGITAPIAKSETVLPTVNTKTTLPTVTQTILSGSQKKDTKSVIDLGYGPVSDKTLNDIVKSGKAAATSNGDKVKYYKTSDKVSANDDLGPVVKKFTADPNYKTESNKDKRTWFKESSYASDGYQFGDISKTLLSSSIDVMTNAATGIIGMGEQTVDTLAMLGTTLGNAQLSQNAENQLILKSLQGKSTDEITKKYSAIQTQTKKYISEFVKKDLYDEEAVAKKFIKEKLEKMTGVDSEKGSVFAEKSDSLAQSFGQLVAMAGLAKLGVPGSLTIGLTSFGSQAAQALNEGANFEQATLSAAVSACAEILSEKLSGGIKLGGNTLDDVILKPVIEQISNKVVKTLVNIGVDAVGEGFEELFSGVLSNLGTALYKEENIKDILFSEEALSEYIESFIGGAFLGGMSSGVKATVSGVQEFATEKKAKAEAEKKAAELNDIEKKVVDKEVENRIAEKEEDGKKLTKKEKDKIYNEVVKALDEGDISIDTIESVLGGDTYKTYKDTVDSETALQKEFDTLNKMKQGDMTGEQIDRRAELKSQLEKVKNNSNTSKLKEQLSSEVFSLAKDSRLSESYNEVSRRKEAFTADLSKYDKKQQAVIQKAIDSGILNNTNKTHKFVDFIAKVSADKGVSFDFSNSEKLKASGFSVEGRIINGLVTEDGTVIINANSSKALDTVVGHEIMHLFEGTEFYNAVAETVVSLAKTKGEYQTRYDEIAKLYENVKNADVNKELIADLVGDYLFSDSEFIERLSTQHRNVFQKIYDEIKYLCRVAAAGSKEARELEKVKKAFEKAYRNAEVTKNTAEGGVRYSLNIQHSNGAVEELADARTLTDEQALNYLKQAKTGELRGHTYIPVRKDTPQVIIDTLKQVGENVDNLSLVMQVRKAQQSMSEKDKSGRSQKTGKNIRGHALTPEQILEIVNSLDNPTLIVYQTERYDKNGKQLPNNVAVFVEYNNGQNEGTAVVEFDSEFDSEYIGNEYGDTNYHTVVTVFEPDTIRNGEEYDYAQELLENPNNIELEIRRRQPNESATQEKHPNTFSELPSSVNSISHPTENVKQKQLEIIEKVNPAPDTYHTWIRKIEDIKTLAETLEDSDWADGDEFNPDLTRDMIEEAIESGEITVYSSYPIEQGVFVSPSYMEAASYSGDGNVYEKTVSIDAVAWIDPTQGMYANVKENQNVQFSLSNNIEKVDEILYNKSNPLSINNRAKTNNNSSLKWVYDAEIFSVEESKLFHEKISEINTGRHSFGNNKNTLGEYMIPIENKIIFTDGNYDSPYVREIVEVLTEYQTEFEAIKERIYNVEKGKSSKQDEVQIIKQMYGDGYIISYNSGNNGVYDWQNGKRKGRTRSSVIRNHLNKQFRGRDDRTGEETPINEISPIKEASSADGVFFDGRNNNFSLSSERTPKKYGNVYGEDILLEKDEDIAPVREDVSPLKKEQVQDGAGEDIAPVREDIVPVKQPETRIEDIAPVREDIAPKQTNTETMIDAPIKTVEERLTQKIKNYQTELTNNQRLLEKSNAEFDELIAGEQAKYNAKKKKNTKAANEILRRIEVLKRRKSNIAADFSKRISDIEGKIARADGKLLSYQEGMNNEQTDRLERYKKRSEARLEADKKVLTEEYEQKKAELQKKFKDKNTFISNKARRLYDEANDMKKGRRVSKELGFFLDLRKEFKIDYPEFKSNLFHVSRHPDTVIDANSKMEAVIRDELSKEFQAGAKEFEELDAKFAEEIKQAEEDAQKKLDNFEIANRRMTKQAELEEQMAELIGDTSTWKDKKYGIQYKVNTLRRNLRDIVRDSEGKRDIPKADKIYDELQGKYNRHEAELFREANRIKKPFAELDITKAEDKYIQMLGELRNNPDTTLSFDTVEKFYEENQEDINKDKVEKVIKEARVVFDELLVRVNEVLREHGMREIPRREGYFPHYTEDKQGFLGKLFNWKTHNDDVPTDIAGMTEGFNPTRSWQSFNKTRTSDDTTYGFMQGFDTYVHGALDWIYHIEDLQKRRAFENHIRYIHSEQGIKEQIDAIRNSEEFDADTAEKQIELVYQNAKNPLNNFVTDFRTATNTLAAKKSSMDRGMEEATNRKVYSTMTNISNRTSANLVAGVISSAITNFIPITQSWAEVSPISSAKAMKQTIASYMRDDGTVDKSNFLTTRLRAPENLYKTTWDKISDKVGLLMEAIDDFSSQTVWRSKYIENISKGMSENEAIKNADQFAENVIAGRSRGNNPTIFDSKNPLIKIFTAFQLEVNNSYGYMLKDMPQDIGSKSKAKLIKGYAGMFFGAYAFNALYSSIVGRDAAFDPVGIIEDVLQDLGVIGDDWLPKEILEALGLLDEDDEEEETDVSDVLGAIGDFAKNVAEEIPFIGGLLGGGRIPISAALPYDGNISELWDNTTEIVSELNFEEGMSKFWDSVKETVKSKKFESLTNEWLNPVFYLALPMAGGQIRKTYQGLQMFDDDLPIAGSYTDSGNLRYPVDDTVGSKIQAALFGQYANKNAQTYFDEGYAPLKEKQIQELIDTAMEIEDYWKYREGLSGLKTLNEKGDYIGNLDLPVGTKNILINNIADRDTPIDMKSYKLYEDFEEFDFAQKKPEEYKVLQEQGIPVSQYLNSIQESAFIYTDDISWAASNPEAYTLSKAVTSNVFKYKEYTKNINSFKADTDEDGKTISGSAKEKKKAYIWNLNIPDEAKYILFRSAYKADDTYNYEIVQYIKSRSDLSDDEKKTILTELDFEIDDEGNIDW